MVAKNCLSHRQSPSRIQRQTKEWLGTTSSLDTLETISIRGYLSSNFPIDNNLFTIDVRVYGETQLKHSPERVQQGFASVPTAPKWSWQWGFTWRTVDIDVIPARRIESSASYIPLLGVSNRKAGAWWSADSGATVRLFHGPLQTKPNPGTASDGNFRLHLNSSPLVKSVRRH